MGGNDDFLGQRTPDIDTDITTQDPDCLSWPDVVHTGSDRRHFTDSIATENVWKAWLGWIHPRSEKGIRWVQSCESHVQEHVVRARLRIRYFPELKLLNSFIGVHQPCAHL
jgi:hypothetical protein